MTSSTRKYKQTEHTHTIPWNDEELIRVNGHKLAYYLRRGMFGGEAIVFFPGGKRRTVQELQQDGFTVVYPKR